MKEPLNLPHLLKLAAEATPEGEQGNRNWRSYPCGMDQETMRSFGFLSSHNKTPFIMKHRANFIEACSPTVITELVNRLMEAEKIVTLSSQLSPKDAQGNLRKKSGIVREKASEYLEKYK